MRDPKIELAMDLIKLEEPDIETAKLVQRILAEFGITCTETDINAVYSSYLPDNFEAESNMIKHYERNFMHQFE